MYKIKFKPACFFAGELEEPKFLWYACGALLEGAITGMAG